MLQRTRGSPISQHAVVIRSARADAVDLVLAGTDHDAVAIGRLGFDLGSDAAFALAGDREDAAVGVADAALLTRKGEGRKMRAAARLRPWALDVSCPARAGGHAWQ